MAERTYEFNWDIIGDLQEGRPNLGDQVNLILYCLMQYTFREVAVKKFGSKESKQMFFDAGHISGTFFFEHYLKEYQNLPLDGFLEKLHSIFIANGVKFLRIDSVDADQRKFSFSLTTEIDPIGADGVERIALETLKIDDCDYEAGFIGGILFKYTGKEFTVETVNTKDVRDILPKWGDLINLIPYRMLQYTVRDTAEQRVGTEACDTLFYEAGEIAGEFFFEYFLKKYKGLSVNEFAGELQRVLKELGVGILRVEKADVENGSFVLTVSEDLDCSGLPDLGIEVCNYDEGFIAGIFYNYIGVAFTAKEVDCWCSGDRTCRFSVKKV
jgi:predicted hydrocarbon binding protein